MTNVRLLSFGALLGQSAAALTSRLKFLTNQKKLVLSLATISGVVWVLAAIHPLDREAWFLENILLLAFIGALSFAHRRLQLSKASYVLLAAFVLLHIV